MSTTRLPDILTVVGITILLTVFGSSAQHSAPESGIRESSSSRPYAETEESHDQVFDLNASQIKPTKGLIDFADTLRRAAGDSAIHNITITGAASPDGPVQTNVSLARRRAEALLGFFRESVPSASDSLYSVSSVGEDWAGMTALIPACLNERQISQIEALMKSTPDLDQRERKLRILDNGRVWNTLKREVFPHLRRASATVRLRSGRSISYTIDSTGASETHPVPEPEPEPEPEPAPEPEPPVIEEPAAPVPTDGRIKHWYLKTNVPAWPLLWINLAGEVDCADHFSVNLPIYYSGFNYFTSARKYRTFTLQPEVRYWFRPDNQGFFVNAHMGVSWYNVAFTGPYRYQDHDGDTPAYGGGIGVGFRFNISRNGLWKLEASVGGGIYRLKYDLFENRPNGLLVGTKSRTFYCLDNVALSICYTFDMTRRKKGGDR